MTDKHWWERETWCMLQTNMRETDMRDLDAERFVRDVKDFGATVVLLNTGGIIASYDTRVEDHTKSGFLTGDPLEKLMRRCREEGIRVAARMDFSKARRPVYEKHPDWAYRTADGQIVDYNGDVHMCLCGGYQQEKAFEIIREAVETLPIDALFLNMGGFQTRDYSYREYGICHCGNCQKAFRGMFALPLPDKADPEDPVYRKYRIFQNRVISDHRRRIGEMVHKSHPEIAIEGIDFARIESNTEYRVRPLPYDPYCSASVIRGVRGTGNGLRCSNPSVDFIGFFYRHVAVSPALQALRCWQNVANFGWMDYYIMSRLDNHEDRSGFEEVKKAFSFVRAHADEYRGIRSVADVLLVRAGGYAASADGKGWVRALTETHILFDEAEPPLIDRNADLNKYRAVILADVRTLPEDACALLDAYAEQGGCLIADGDTGRFDGDGNEREGAALRALGIRRILYRRHDMTSAMLRAEEEDRKVFTSDPGMGLFYFGDDYVYAEYTENTTRLLRLIPPHMYGPPERCYYTQITDLPGAAVHPWGKGKGIYIPWCPGSLYQRDGHANTFLFMKDLLLGAAGVPTAEDRPFTPMVAVTVGECPGSHLLIQLVNHTGHFGTSFFPPVPVSPVPVAVRCPREPARAVSQTTGKEVPFRWKDGTLRLSADCSSWFEGILISFGEDERHEQRQEK